jgi:hypothetical protein
VEQFFAWVASMTIASVNVHFQGTDTAPICHADEVIDTPHPSGMRDARMMAIICVLRAS